MPGYATSWIKAGALLDKLTVKQVLKKVKPVVEKLAKV